MISLVLEMAIALQMLFFSLYSVLQNTVCKVTTLFLSGGGAGIFIVLVNLFLEPSSVKIFFSHEKERKIFIFLSCGTEIHFSICCWCYTTQIQQRNIFFLLAGVSINLFSATT